MFLLSCSFVLFCFGEEIKAGKWQNMGGEGWRKGGTTRHGGLRANRAPGPNDDRRTMGKEEKEDYNPTQIDRSGAYPSRSWR
jgi:hypothetical protein